MAIAAGKTIRAHVFPATVPKITAVIDNLEQLLFLLRKLGRCEGRSGRERAGREDAE
jgi:hypothetical protein